MDKLINEVWQLVCLTREEFEALYVSTLKNVQKKRDNIDVPLRRAIRALKIRRAYLLPIGSDAETCYAQQEAWSFAVFLQSLTWETPIQWRELISKQTEDWLGGFDEVVQVLDESKTGIIVQIIEQALTGFVVSNNLFEQLSNWLDQLIENKRIPINEANSLIHILGDGVLLKMPEGFEFFIQENAAFIQSNFGDGVSESGFIQELTKGNHLIRAKDSFLHQYFWGDWSERIHVTGIVIRYSSKVPISITSDLKPEILN